MRFSLKHHGQLSCVEHCPEGEYVLHADYARLKAEVEELTKAGDAMAAHIERNDELCYEVIPDGDIRISEWNAAKEGKGQP
jgi:hypothetical protein